MRSIGRALAELLGVLTAGFIGFFVMLGYLSGVLVWFACGVVCFCFLLVALCSMVMWLFTREVHAFHVMLGYFAYAGAAYAVIAAMSYYRGRLTDAVRKRNERAALGRIGRLRLAEDANFDAASAERPVQ
jgi:hypothetical protein